MAFSPKLLQMGASGAKSANYIEDVFSTYLYTGTGSALTITNNIDLSTKGGLVWIKKRSGTAEPHVLVDSARGATKALRTSGTDAEVNDAGRVSAFTTSGFSIGTDGELNTSSATHVSWTFRKQPKFFDCVTYTGDGSTNRSIAHNLQSMPGFVIIKRTDSTSNWYVAARMANTDFLVSTWTTPTFFALNSTGAAPNDSAATNVATDSVFYLKMGGDATASVSYTNINNATYVAYLFAHDAGGFGLTGTDNVISCGSFTGNGNNTITLGYEPQFILLRRTSSPGNNWELIDTMRGASVSTGSQVLYAESTAAEGVGGTNFPTATGFYSSSYGSGTVIYIAIRRPMKVPTVGTSVFTPSYGLNAGANGQAWNAGFLVDMYIRANPTSVDFYTSDRLRNSLNYVLTDSDGAESTVAFSDKLDNNIGVFSTNAYDYRTWIGWQFRRAPSFFDVVCYTGTGGASQNYSHSLGVVPELIIIKNRNRTNENWLVYHKDMGAQYYLSLNQTSAKGGPDAARFPSTPTSSVFTVGTDPDNGGAFNFVSYLFATCAGVSKVGSYTGTATTNQINCGFTTGARFVMIKRTDATSDWYVWDTARGIIAGNDPYLLLNSSASEVTNTDYIDPYSPGFELSSTAPAAINNSGGTYIFLAIA